MCSTCRRRFCGMECSSSDIHGYVQRRRSGWALRFTDRVCSFASIPHPNFPLSPSTNPISHQTNQTTRHAPETPPPNIPFRSLPSLAPFRPPPPTPFLHQASIITNHQHQKQPAPPFISPTLRTTTTANANPPYNPGEISSPHLETPPVTHTHHHGAAPHPAHGIRPSGDERAPLG